ncbi:MAG: hypothetical protein Q7T19_11510 [Caulobacter sp.]|nr:hypothetical protein [Caulobacter sp.]
MTSIVEGFVALGVLAALVPLGVMAVRRVKRSKGRAAMAGMLLLFGAFLKVDPPPLPPSERVIKDSEDDEAAGAPPTT